MGKDALDELTRAVRAKDMMFYRIKNKRFREEHIEVVGNKAKEKYGTEPVIDVVWPRDPFIDSRVLIIPPEKGSNQKYDILQTFGGGYITTVDVVSLPKKSHNEIQNIYIQNILEQFPWYYVAGGHIELKDIDNIRLHGTSTEFGSSIAGYDANSIAAYILNLTQKFKNVDVKMDKSLKTDADEFFDMWLGLFKDIASKGSDIDDFFKEAYRIHREKSSESLASKYLAEIHIRAMNDPRAEEDIYHAMVENMLETQREVFQDMVKRKLKK